MERADKAKHKLYNGKIAEVLQDAGEDAGINATPYKLKFEHVKEGEEGLTEEQAVAEFKDAHVKPPPEMVPPRHVAGPSSPELFVSRSVRRALLTRQVNRGSLYHRAQST